MSYLRFIPVVLIVLFLSSCTAYQRFTVEEQAKAKIPENTRGIGVVNNINSLGSDRPQSQSVEQTRRERGEAASAMATNGVFNSILTHRGRAKVIDTDSIFNTNLGLDWSYIDSIREFDSLDVIIELVDFDASMSLGTAPLALITGQPGSQRLKGTLGVNIYIIDSVQFLGEFTVKNAVDVPMSGNLIDVDNDVRRKREAYELVGYNMGFASAELMYSHRIDVNRKYYTSGSPGAKAAKKMMNQRNWTAAETELLKTADDGKPTPRGRTLYNLAVVYEAQGNIDKAIEYAERSAYECSNLHAKSYLNELLKRRGDIE